MLTCAKMASYLTLSALLTTHSGPGDATAAPASLAVCGDRPNRPSTAELPLSVTRGEG